jgi:hypothetical protein
VRRSALGLILIAVVMFPGGGPNHHGTTCHRPGCAATGAVIWSQPLTGSWVADSDAPGTVFARGQAYAAVGGDVAAVGFGLTVAAFDAGTGLPWWQARLSGVPAGSAIMSVRAWPGVITVGVGTGSDEREEFVLNAVTGKQVRAYQASLFGGAVDASQKQTVIVERKTVTSYANATGKVLWRDSTGPAGQAWRVSDGQLYVTVSATGEAGSAPVTAVRQISLRTGDERLIQPVGPSFNGRLSGAVDGVLLFSGADGLRMYSEASGRLTGKRAGAVPEVVDPVLQVLYVDVGGALIGVDPVTGDNERGTTYPGPPGTYGVRDGVALGLDPGAHGAAWGYNIAKQHVIWTSKPLPWPHFFVDLSGIGGSVDPLSNRVLLVTCANVGQATRSVATGDVAQTCLRPMLVAIQR